MKYRRPGVPPLIHVSAEQRDAEWVISVRDNGIGFDPVYAKQIFTPFKRLHSQEEYAGTGVGLAICKRIVEGHGGRIWADSQAGQGTTFHSPCRSKGKHLLNTPRPSPWDYKHQKFLASAELHDILRSGKP